jgi:hypothetical protein
MNLALIEFLGSSIKHALNMKTCTTFTGRAGPDGELFYRYRVCKLGYCLLIIEIGTNTQIYSLQVDIAIRLRNRKPLPVHSSITLRSTAQRCAVPSVWIWPTVGPGMGYHRTCKEF